MLGQRIKELRLEKGWTVEELANRVNRSKSTISEIENNKNKPGRKLIELFSTEFRVTTDYIMGLSNHKELSSKQSSEVERRLSEFAPRIEKMSPEKIQMLMETVDALINTMSKPK